VPPQATALGETGFGDTGRRDTPPMLDPLRARSGEADDPMGEDERRRFGSKVREARKATGMTQQQLADGSASRTS
jgi:ribosome-binding protein aMBF1 (putative translation factor)